MALLGPAWKIVAPFQAKSIPYNICDQYCFFSATGLRDEPGFSGGKIVLLLNIVLQLKL